ncbi:hypothetical protein OIU76_005408 [Salix suchowensis]|nr:hypothetical protein OIU76_005408 [Salix suchowensis]
MKTEQLGISLRERRGAVIEAEAFRNLVLAIYLWMAIVSVFPDPTGASSQNTLADNRSSQSTIEAKSIFPRTKQPSSRSENSLRSPIKLRVSS